MLFGMFMRTATALGSELLATLRGVTAALLFRE